MSSRFSGGASGQVANGVKAHGGVYARLKSSTTLPGCYTPPAGDAA